MFLKLKYFLETNLNKKRYYVIFSTLSTHKNIIQMIKTYHHDY